MVFTQASDVLHTKTFNMIEELNNEENFLKNNFHVDN